MLKVQITQASLFGWFINIYTPNFNLYYLLDKANSINLNPGPPYFLDLWELASPSTLPTILHNHPFRSPFILPFTVSIFLLHSPPSHFSQK